MPIFGIFGVASATDAPSVSAASWAVYDATAGRFLGDGAGDEVRPMASTTKIMTALVAIERFDLEKEVEFSREMAAEGSSMYLKFGEKCTIRELLFGLMLMSGNDAARAIASVADGGEAGFVELMNERASALGLANTAFENPNGLDADGHHTTAKELALLAAEAMKSEIFREIVSSSSASVAGRSMKNHNKLLGRIDGCVGVKTGYTSDAGRCLVSAVERYGRLIIITTLNAPDDWDDHEALAAWAFEAFPKRSAVEAGSAVEYISVQSGTSAMVAVRTGESVELALSDDEFSQLERTILLEKFVYAPVAEGEKAGELLLKLGGVELARVPLEFAASVERVEAKKLGFFGSLREFFGRLRLKNG